MIKAIKLTINEEHTQQITNKGANSDALRVAGFGRGQVYTGEVY